MKYLTIISIFTLLLCPLRVHAYIPSDPFATQAGYELIGAYDAWDNATGSRDIVVAVIDNGFDYYHPELVKNTWRNPGEIPNNHIDDDANGYIDDVVGWNFIPKDTDGDGDMSEVEAKGNNDPRPDTSSLEGDETTIVSHATAVAGIIGASGHNAAFGSGINWHVSLMNLKIVGNSGNGTLAYLADAIRYAVDNGADVISMSVIGSLEEVDIIIDAVQYAYEHDVVVVAAAGNGLQDLSGNPLYPICADANTGKEWVIGVSAVHTSRQFARFSNFGGDCIDITAPGVGVSSTVRYAPSAGLTTYYRGKLQGTSFAVPMVSGAAALIKSKYPTLGAAEIIDILLSSTSKTPPDDEELYVNLFGAGLLRVDQALALADERHGAIEPYGESVSQGGDTFIVGIRGITSATSTEDVYAIRGSYTATYDVISETITLKRNGVYLARWQVAGAIDAVQFDEVRNVLHMLSEVDGVYTITSYTFFGAPVLHTTMPSLGPSAQLESAANGTLLLSDIVESSMSLYTFGEGDSAVWHATAYMYDPTRVTSLGDTYITHGTSGEADVLVQYDAEGTEKLRRTIPAVYGDVLAFGNIGGMVYTVHTDIVVYWDIHLDTVQISVR